MAAPFHLSLKQKIMMVCSVLIITICYWVNSFSFIGNPVKNLIIFISDSVENLTIRFAYKIHKSEWIDKFVPMFRDKIATPFHDDKIVTILIDPKQNEVWQKAYGKPSDSEEAIEWRKMFRGSLARLVKKLSDVGARVIVLDYGFKMPLSSDKGEPNNDDLLIEAIQSAKKRGTSVIIATDVENYKALNDSKFLNAVGNNGYGLPDAKTKKDYIFQIPLIVSSTSSDKDKLYSLSLKAVEAYFDGNIDMDKKTFELRRIKVKQNNICKEHICRFFDSGTNFFEHDDVAFLYIDFYRSPDEHTVPILYKDFDDYFNDDNNLKLVNKFNGKIMMVGSKTDNELHTTTVGKSYGVQIHADAVNTIFNDIEHHRTIQALTRIPERFFILLFMILGFFCTIKMSDKSNLFKIISVVLLAMLCFVFSIVIYAFGQERILTNWIYYFIAFISTFWVTFYRKETP